MGVNNYVLGLNQTHFSIAKVKITYEKKPTHISIIISLEGIENSKQKLKQRTAKESKQSCEHFQVEWLVFFSLKKTLSSNVAGSSQTLQFEFQKTKKLMTIQERQDKKGKFEILNLICKF